MSSITLACWVHGDEHASVWVQVNLQVGTNKVGTSGLSQLGSWII